MIYTIEQKKEARAYLKAIGYKLHVRTSFSPFTGKAFEHLAFSKDGHKLPFDSAAVFGQARFEEHKEAFAIMSKVFRP